MCRKTNIEGRAYKPTATYFRAYEIRGGGRVIKAENLSSPPSGPLNALV
jgi:hypothetical protein